MRPLGGFQSLWQFDTDDHEGFVAAAAQAMGVLATMSGFSAGEVLHNLDEHRRYVVVTRWLDVGSYRRAMSSPRAKLEVWPFLAAMRDEPSAYETRAEVAPGSVTVYESSAAGD